MLKAIIIDNEEPALNILKILLEKTGHIEVVGSFTNGSEALSNLEMIKPNVAFLDIEMPEASGLELARLILTIDSDIEIIFVTAYDQYALSAFRVNALDYLLKPLSLEDIENAVGRLIKRKGLAGDSASKSPVIGRIYCFGKFSMYGPTSIKTVKWRTSKTEELFAYMVQNLEKQIPKWRICEDIWPEYDAEKIDIQLHTTVYRLKKVLKSTNIPFELNFINGCYWLSLPHTFIDKIEFDAYTSSSIPIEASTIAKYEQALSLYTGDYLEENDYHWSAVPKGDYLQKFYRLATSMVEYYMQNKDYPKAVKNLRNILEKFPFDEVAHELLLKCYSAQKDRTAFITHYHRMQELFKTELNIEPGKSVQALYYDIF